jgi:hypothetical protein
VDFGGLLLLGFLWVVFNLLTKGRQQRGGRPSKLPTGLPPAAPPSRGDPTQREGSRLEALLREFERALEQGAGSGPLGRPSTSPLPTAEEVEERESLEAESEATPEVVSLEAEVARPERPHVSQDEGAERLVARRIAAADARSGAHSRVDHAAFDQRIRQQPADATAVRSVTSEQLRRAVVWREVLGPPVGLRDEER